ncbi:MAG: ribosome silencing factor [Gammaproteobacteria bacterium]|nr:ribosome silencing factor [Gammaproteobacteria bacterium]
MTDAVVAVLAQFKAVNVAVLDVRGKTSISDYLVVAGGNSQRHLATMKRAVLDFAKSRKLRPLGVEGSDQSEWQLIDLADCVVHLMRPEARAFYDLERLWSVGPEESEARRE